MRGNVLLLDARLIVAWHLRALLDSVNIEVAAADVVLAPAWMEEPPRGGFHVLPPRKDYALHVEALRCLISKGDRLVPIFESGLFLQACAPDLDASLFSLHCGRALHDKSSFHDIAVRAGVHTPAILDPLTKADIEMVRRPRHGRSGTGLVRLRTPTNIDVSTDDVYTAYIAGHDESSLSLISSGSIAWHVSYAASRETSVLTSLASEETVAVATALVNEMELHDGFLGLDFRRDLSGVLWLLECNPRPTRGTFFLRDGDTLAAALFEKRRPSLSVTPSGTTAVPVSQAASKVRGTPPVVDIVWTPTSTR